MRSRWLSVICYLLSVSAERNIYIYRASLKLNKMKICHKKQDGDAVCISKNQFQTMDQLIDIMFGRLINTSCSSRAFRTT